MAVDLFWSSPWRRRRHLGSFCWDPLAFHRASTGAGTPGEVGLDMQTVELRGRYRVLQGFAFAHLSPIF
jgi:hypothetical protein